MEPASQLTQAFRRLFSVSQKDDCLYVRVRRCWIVTDSVQYQAPANQGKCGRITKNSHFNSLFDGQIPKFDGETSPDDRSFQGSTAFSCLIAETFCSSR